MSEELHELIVAWLGGEISDTRREQLLELLRNDEALRAAFVTETRTFAMLQAVQSAEPRWLSLQDELGITDAPTISFEDRIRTAIEQRPASSNHRRWSKVALLAVCATVMLAASYLLRIAFVTSPVQTQPAALEQIAVVVGIEKVVWPNFSSRA